MREGEKRISRGREWRERLRMGKSKWGIRLKEDWKALGVNTVRGWCNKVKDRGWLASKMGEGRKKKGKKKTVRDITPQRNVHLRHVQSG